MNRIEFYLKLDKYKAEDKKAKEEAAKGEVIMHYGIPNMKWGQRRWQNADGTFNEEGKIRYFGKNGTTKKNKEEKIGGFGFREIRDRERITDRYSDEDKGYLQIKPEREMSKKEREDAIRDIFEQARYGSQPDDQKIGGFHINDNKTTGQMFAERMTNKELYNLISFMEKHNYDQISDDDTLNDYITEAEKRMNRLGSLPGKDLDKKTTINDTIKGLFSKKKDNLPDKIREEAKKLREVGEDELADKYEKHAKDMEAYRKIGHAPGATEQEIKEARRSAANAYATAYRNKWPLFLIFGPIGGAIIGSIASNAKVNKIIDQLGLDKQDKDKFTAADWDAINEAIKESRRKKPKNQTTTE